MYNNNQYHHKLLLEVNDGGTGTLFEKGPPPGSSLIAFEHEESLFLKLAVSSSQRVRLMRKLSTSCLIRSISFSLYSICVSKSKIKQKNLVFISLHVNRNSM